MSVPNAKRPRTSNKQNVSTGNSDSDAIVFTTSDTEEKYVDIVKKNLDQFFEIANKHDFQLSIHGESPTRVSVRLTKSSGKGDTKTVISEMNELIEEKLNPEDKHLMNLKEYGYKNENIFLQQENFQVIRDSSRAMNKLAGMIRDIGRLSPSAIERLIIYYFDFVQKDPLGEQKKSGFLPDQNQVASWMTLWPYRAYFPYSEDVIARLRKMNYEPGVLGTVHLMSLNTEKGAEVFALVIMDKQIVCVKNSLTEANVIDDLHSELYKDDRFEELQNNVGRKHVYLEFRFATHLPIKQKNDECFVHAEKEDHTAMFEENEKVLTFMRNNFKCLQYSLPDDGYKLVGRMASLYNFLYSLV